MACLAQFVQQKFDAVDGVQGAQEFSEDPYAIQLILGQEKLFLARP